MKKQKIILKLVNNNHFFRDAKLVILTRFCSLRADPLGLVIYTVLRKSQRSIIPVYFQNSIKPPAKFASLAER